MACSTTESSGACSIYNKKKNTCMSVWLSVKYT